MALAEGLRGNTQLETLNLEHAAIAERGTLVLADMLKDNKTLKLVRLAGNPIGRRGGRAVLRAIRRCLLFGWERTISIANSNYACDGPESLFNPGEPWPTAAIPMEDPYCSCRLTRSGAADCAGGEWACDLADHYQRMVAWELVELAWEQHGENWQNEKLDGKPYDLPEPVTKTTPPPSISPCRSLSVRFSSCRSRTDTMMTRCESFQATGEVWSREDYNLPEEGFLTLTYRVTPRIPRFGEVVEVSFVQYLITRMRSTEVTDGGLRLLKLAAEEFYFTAAQCGLLLAILKDSVAKVEAMAALLPRVVDHINLNACAFEMLTDTQLAAVESKVGRQLFYFTPRNPTARYRLLLDDPNDAVVYHRLLALSHEQTSYRRLHEVIDTSQKGDFENFRSERLNGARLDIDLESISVNEPASSGLMEFDYVSTDCSHRLAAEVPMPAHVFDEFVRHLAGCHALFESRKKNSSRTSKAKGSSKRKKKAARKPAVGQADLAEQEVAPCDPAEQRTMAVKLQAAFRGFDERRRRGSAATRVSLAQLFDGRAGLFATSSNLGAQVSVYTQCIIGVHSPALYNALLVLFHSGKSTDVRPTVRHCEQPLLEEGVIFLGFSFWKKYRPQIQRRWPGS